MYIYIYVERERCINVYIYIYREREMFEQKKTCNKSRLYKVRARPTDGERETPDGYRERER